MIPVSHLVPASIERVLRQAPLTPEKVEFAWRYVVGPALAKATTVSLHGKVLRVRADSTAWQREVEKATAIIRTRLARLLGDGVVAGFDVVIR